MFSWVNDLISGGEGPAPITEIVGAALEAPFVYFIGMALLSGAIVLVKRVIRRY